MTSYAKRDSLLDKGEQFWTVEDIGLAWARPDGFRQTMRWIDVTDIRLAYAPTRWKSWRRTLTLTARSGAVWTIDNAHFKGVGDFEDRTPAFAELVRACVARIAEAAPTASARLGSTPGAYWSQILMLVVVYSLLAIVIFNLPVAFPAVVWVKLGLIVLSLPVLARWLVGARPRKIPLTVEAFSASLPPPGP